MTPNHGYDPTDPRAQQQQAPGQQPPPPGQQPPPQQSPPVQRQPPQMHSQPASHPPQSAHQGVTQQPSGPPPQQQGQFGQGTTPPEGTNPSPGMQGAQPASGMQAPPQQQMPRRTQRPSRTLLQPVTVDDIAAEDVATAERDTPVRTVVTTMAERDIGSVVVVEDDEPVGIITDRKVALSMEETPEVAQRTVGELISDDLVTADPSTNIFDVVRLMGDNGIRRIPVVDEDGKLQGIVTLDDAVVLLGTELGNVAETIQAQIDRL